MPPNNLAKSSGPDALLDGGGSTRGAEGFAGAGGGGGGGDASGEGITSVLARSENPSEPPTGSSAMTAGGTDDSGAGGSSTDGPTFVGRFLLLWKTTSNPVGT